MTKRTRAPKTKSKIREITCELSTSSIGTNSLNVVRELRKRHANLIDDERDAIIDLGLMVLAGRASISNGPESESTDPDLFREMALPDLIRMKVKVGNRLESRVCDARSMTPAVYFEGSAEIAEREARVHKVTKAESFHEKMQEMQAKGLGNMTLHDYLNSIT